MEIDSSRLRRDRVIFYVGLTLLCLGLPGLMAGSWLHDAMRIPVVGGAYSDWGWVNQMFAALGLFISVVGVVFIGLSLRGGVIFETDDEENAEGDR